MPNIPYYVLPYQDGKAKAVFTVPSHLIADLIANPILANGGSFTLQVDEANQMQNSDTSFLFTEYVSPSPEETALAISQRLAIRVADAGSSSSIKSLIQI
jgi:hypothetical protein